MVYYYYLQITAGLSHTCYHSHAACLAISEAPYIHFWNHTIHVHNKQPWRHNTIQPQSNISRKPLARFHSYSDTRPTTYLKTPLLSTISLQLHLLLASATYHANQSYHMLFPISYMPKIHLSHSIYTVNNTCLTANTLLFLNLHSSVPVAHSVPALTLLISTLSYSLPITLKNRISLELLDSCLSPFPLYRGTNALYMHHASSIGTTLHVKIHVQQYH